MPNVILNVHRCLNVGGKPEYQAAGQEIEVSQDEAERLLAAGKARLCEGETTAEPQNSEFAALNLTERQHTKLETAYQSMADLEQAVSRGDDLNLGTQLENKIREHFGADEPPE